MFSMSDVNLNRLILSALPKSEFIAHSTVISKYDLSPILHISLPKSIVTERFILDEIACIDDLDKIIYVPIESLGKPVMNTPWIDIGIKHLNVDAGMHTYRLRFIRNDDCVNLYVSYTIQDDNPEKPYIYMNRK